MRGRAGRAVPPLGRGGLAAAARALVGAGALWVALPCAAATTLVERGVIDAAPGAATRATLALDLVLLQGSGWRGSEIDPLVQSLAQRLEQCGVGLTRVRWFVLSVPSRWLDFSTPRATELVRAFEVRRPAAFLVRDTRQLPAFDAEAIGRGNSRTRPELRDTVWLTRALPHPQIGLAHELVHVLMNTGEHDARPGNLMRDRSAPQNTRLEPDQCDRVPAQGRANGLLGPAP